MVGTIAGERRTTARLSASRPAARTTFPARTLTRNEPISARSPPVERRVYV